VTHVYGIIGDPVAQVRSPAVFNARFQAAGLDAVMVPMHVIGNRLELTLAGLRAIENLAGLVITVPHKPAAARLLRSCSDRVRLAGAANVLRPTPDGWDGDLFDGEGFAIGIEANGFQLAGKHCALVGAGGAGAAIAVALITREIAELTVFDIDEDKTSDLVTRLQRLGLCPISAGQPCRATDLAINATPLGMDAADPLPFDVDCLRPESMVADAIMKPPVTRLLVEAAKRGCRTQEGRHMLDSQVDAIWDFFGLSR
jgi:shikimate dehydrogenase